MRSGHPIRVCTLGVEEEEEEEEGNVTGRSHTDRCPSCRSRRNHVKVIQGAVRVSVVISRATATLPGVRLAVVAATTVKAIQSGNGTIHVDSEVGDPRPFGSGVLLRSVTASMEVDNKEGADKARWGSTMNGRGVKM